jgi:hypothetical protein
MVYVLMALLGAGGAIFTIMRSKARAELLSVHLVAWGMVCLAEWFAHSIFESYRYRPGLALDPHIDTSWGVFFGEFIFLPTLSVVLVAWFRPWIGVAVGTALVATMEVVFIPLGVFIHKGWPLWLTLATFPFYFGASYLYWRWARETRMQDRRVLAAAKFGALVGVVTIMSLVVYAARLTATDVQLLPSAEANGSLMRLLMHGLGILLGFWALLPQPWSERWGRLALIFAGMMVITDGFSTLGWLYFLRPFSGVLDAGAIGVCTILVGVITDWVAALAGAPRDSGVARWEPPEI